MPLRKELYRLARKIEVMTMSILFSWRWEWLFLRIMCGKNTLIHFSDYTRPVRYSTNM